MSTYGSSGDHEPPTDPWTDETVRVPPPAPVAQPPVNPVTPAPAGPTVVYPPAAAPQSVPPATYQPAPQPATYQPGQAAYPPQQPAYQPPPPATYQPPAAYQPPPTPYQPQQDYQPGYAQPAYGQQPAYAQPYDEQPQQQWAAPKQRSALVPVLLTLLVVIVVAGISIGIYLLKTRTTTVPETIPAVGTCVKSNGQAYPNAKLNPVDCGVSGSYTVIKEQANTSDKAFCNGVANVNEIFTFTASSSVGQDYVLCLKQN